MKILYLEDNPHDAELTCRQLARCAPKMQVTLAGNLEMARTLLAGESFDLALLDMKVPDGSGMDLLVEIRRRELQTAVVVLTGSGNEATVMNALKAGADDYLVKREDYLVRLAHALEDALLRFQTDGQHRLKPLRVIYAEHHPTDIDLTRRHFSSHAPHIHLKVVESIRALLDRLPSDEASRSDWDVILMDYRMPGFNAIDVLKKLRQDRGLKIPIILVTGQGNQEVAIQAMRMGADDYLIKHPGYLEVLPKVLEIAHHRAQLIREQAALRKSEERFRELFLNMHDGVAIYEVKGDGDDFIFEQLNPAGEAIGNVKAHEVIGRSVKEVFPGIMQMGLLDVFKAVWRTGRPQVHPVTLYRDDQLQMWVENYVRRLSSNHIVAIYKNMTRRKQAEDNLRNSERILRTVIDTSPNCVFVKDDRGAYVLANKSAAQLYGATPQEMIGATDIQLASAKGMRDDDALRFSTEDAQVIASQQPLPIFKEHITLADGSIRWFRTIKVPIDIPGHTRCVLGVATDITDLVASEEQQAMLFTAIAQSPEAVIITDREGVIQFVNPAFETITGFARKEAIGYNPRILKSGTHDAAFYENLWAALLRGETWKGRLVNRKKDGTKYTEEATISPVRSRGGKITHYVAVKRDITRELETETRLRQAQKMEAIGTLAGGIAHDFNNILTSVIGYTELALDEAVKDTSMEEYLKEIHISGLRARDLVMQILAFARQSEGTVEAVTVSRIVTETVKLLRSSVPASIEIRHELASDGNVMADPTQIHQVCMNLCTNAVHAMEEAGGILTIRLEDAYLDRGIIGIHGELKPGRYVVLSISDTGHGIPADIIDAIFEPYFTTKGVGEGTGLGLAVVHGIVKACGGEIRVESQPGKGTAFTVYLPMVHGRQEIADAAGAEDVPGGRERILIVDDEQVIAKVVGQVLERHGYRITIRTSSVEALALFESKSDQFDLVITDMTMPNLTGDLLTAEMLKRRPDLPVILCTGYNKKISDDKVAAIGVKSLIMKPFSRRKILTTVRRVLDDSVGCPKQPHKKDSPSR